MKAYCQAWASWARDPQRAILDHATNDTGELRKHFVSKGVFTDFTGTEQSHQLGRLEHQGGIWKMMWQRVVTEATVVTEEDVWQAAAVVNQAQNEHIRKGGFSASQWVLGRGVRLPGSLTDESEAGRLQVLEEANDPSSHMARQVKWRTEAKKAFVEIDGSERLQRGSRPMRDSYPRGAMSTSTGKGDCKQDRIP